jgi:dihydropteridine reductase
VPGGPGDYDDVDAGTLAPTKKRTKRAVVVGGNGALGRAVVQRFLAREGWQVASVDFAESSARGVHSVVLSDAAGSDGGDGGGGARESLRAWASGGGVQGGVQAVVHAAGSWAGSAVDADDFAASLEHLWSANVRSAALAANLAGNLLAPGGMFTLTGAMAALDPAGTPGMAAYGMTKAATHHLLQSVAQGDGSGGLPGDAYANAILPATIDTEANRGAMPDADTSSWTAPEDIAAQLLEWAEVPASRPGVSGSLVEIRTVDNKTTFNVVV